MNKLLSSYRFAIDDSHVSRYDIRLFNVSHQISRYEKEDNLQLTPDFQRSPDCWSTSQQMLYCEFILKGGQSPPFLFNHPGWMEGFNGEMVLVDGLQRLTAIDKMVNGKLLVFGANLLEYEDYQNVLKRRYIEFRINNLKSKKEVLQWYLQINDGGTVHTKEELEKVQKLLMDCDP